MKSIVTSLGMIVFVAAIVAGGTGAFFNDTETSTGNVFTAGAIDLKVDSVAHVNGLVCFDGKWHPETVVQWNTQTQANELVAQANVPAAILAYNTANPSNVPQAGEVCKGTWAATDLEGEVAYQFFNYGDLKPGDNGENTISLHVKNNDAYMCATVDVTEDLDNTLTEPESDVPDVDGLASGELDNELELIVWEDDGDNVLETAEIENILVETESANGIEGTYDLYTSLTGAIPAETTAYLGVYWCFGDLTRTGAALSCNGAPVGNVSQTDSLKADIKFYVEQARHNEEFTCVRETVPTTGTITVDKVVQFTSDTIAGVEVSDFTLTVDGPGDPVVVVDQVPMPGLAAGAYVVSESYSGVPAGITYDAVFSGACTEIGTTNTGTINLAAGGNQVCTITNFVSPALVNEPLN